MIKRPDRANFERLLTALRCEEPDRVPLFEVRVDNQIKERIIGREIVNLSDEVDFWVTAGYDFVPLRPKGEGLQFWDRVDSRSEQPVIDSKSGARKWGSLKKGRYNLDGKESSITWAEEHRAFITSMDELERFSWPDSDSFDFSRFREIKDKLPENMKTLCVMNTGHTVVWFLMGLETYMLAFKKEPELVRKVYEGVGNTTYMAIENSLLQKDVIGAIVLMDDLGYKTSTMISPAFYREYLFHWYRRFCDLCRSKNVPIILHSCGELSSIIRDIIDCGFNGLHPIMPSATIMNINDVKRKVEGKMCIFGNIDLEYTLTRGSQEEVRTLVRKRILELGPGGGYCVGSGNTIPGYVRLENYCAMINGCFDYGHYPIL